MTPNSNKQAASTFEVIPFLSLNGRAAEAIAFYVRTLDAEILLKVSYADMAGRDESFTFEKGQEDYVTHSVLQIGSGKLMLAEEEMDRTRPWSAGNDFSLCIQSRDHAEIERLYNRLTADERVTVLSPLAPNSFSSGYAAVRDPFGVVFQFTVTRHEF
ncbi:VOC family protein [Saccharibacillus sp. CPCC 101409]|uniref:VOC family protein n=1 Tax=Saccharibacillus sp. CPCC 101409 TaxID=3058041 RepID=UPI002673EC6A|nr:VOC family protein [Saccharibacillus sp. CPCC 101409]MDO3411251.1 VOC family protein [Saccharibacillus sp. CPCC 101409]